MNSRSKLSTIVRCAEARMISIYAAALLLTTGLAAPASAAAGQLIRNNTPPYVRTAKHLGTADPAQVIEVTLWLQPHHRTQLDALAKQLYDPASPRYRHWLTRQELAARFMPTAQEANTVRQFFTAHNLQVLRVGPDNLYVRARGTAGDVEKAFRVQLNNYELLGRTVRANDRDPYVEGPAGSLVMGVLGLDTGKYEHPLVQQSIPKGGTAAAATPARGTSANDIFSNVCFPGVKTESFSTNNNGSLPIGTYSGNRLNLQTLTTSGCGYTPPMVQKAYNLTGLYKEGFDGTGETIGIIDWCGSFTIQADANAFSRRYGLPLLAPSNFQITNLPGPSFCEAEDQVEINIDVEWAHAIAPGASINLIVPPTASFTDVNEAEYMAITQGLANVVSGSYGSIETFTPSAVLANENLVNEIGAVVGISTNFSSGDNGDFTLAGIPATVSAPADSPWATSVGGVTLALNSNNSIAWQAGWGNNETLLAETGFVFDPPLALSFLGGAGGGPSNCATKTVNPQTGTITCTAGFPKPSYQRALPGRYRQVPDISWLADPFTGVAILISLPGNVPAQAWQIWGGTSVACPMFSALWAIANQEALAGGGTELGLAAPYLYSLPAGTIFDIVPLASKTNVTAVLRESNRTSGYTPAQVMGGVNDRLTGKFRSALWDYPYSQFTSLAVSFGTDCAAVPGFGTPCTSLSALRTKAGWDNVTGVGTPNAKAFADHFFGK